MKQGALIVIAVFILAASPVFADLTETIEEKKPGRKLYVTFTYGPTASWLTRIIEQTERSNFVFRNFLPGIYFTTELQNLPLITPEVRAAFYYPLLSSFNHVPYANSPLNFAGDLFAGARFEIGWGFFRINGGPGLHLLFLSSDRWNYFNMGAALAVGIELALSPGWSLLIDGFASIDNGNLGTNKQMEPFNITYQYQTALGVRYSKKKRNASAIFMGKDKDHPPVILDR